MSDIYKATCYITIMKWYKPITSAMSFCILAPTPPATNELHLQGNMLHYHYEVIQAHYFCHVLLYLSTNPSSH